jgi:glycosyltransferase involved in cell wall biosynthesis
LPTVVAVPDIFAVTNPEFAAQRERNFIKRMLPKTVERAARVVVPSRAVKRALADHIDGIDISKVTVVPWGVAERFRPIDDAAKLMEVRQRYDLPEEYILHVGELTPRMGVEDMIQAYFAAMMNKSLPHHLVLVGRWGWGMERLARLISEHNLVDKVHLLGYVPDDDLPALYSGAACSLSPHKAGRFGLSGLEAMACGCPVVGSRLAAESDGARKLPMLECEPGDVRALREGLELLLLDESARSGLVQAGCEYAAGFSWQNNASSLLAIFEEVVSADQSR